jgi:uncharacterized protein (DUF3084 family)
MQAFPWTAELVTALFAGIVAMIYALGKVYTQVRAARAEGRAAGAERDQKLDHIAANVNGNLTKALDEIASLKSQNAMLIEMLAKLAASKTGNAQAVADVVVAADKKP